MFCFRPSTGRKEVTLGPVEKKNAKVSDKTKSTNASDSASDCGSSTSSLDFNLTERERNIAKSKENAVIKACLREILSDAARLSPEASRPLNSASVKFNISEEDKNDPCMVKNLRVALASRLTTEWDRLVPASLLEFRKAKFLAFVRSAARELPETAIIRSVDSCQVRLKSRHGLIKKQKLKKNNGSGASLKASVAVLGESKTRSFTELKTSLHRLLSPSDGSPIDEARVIDTLYWRNPAKGETLEWLFSQLPLSVEICTCWGLWEYLLHCEDDHDAEKVLQSLIACESLGEPGNTVMHQAARAGKTEICEAILHSDKFTGDAADAFVSDTKRKSSVGVSRKSLKSSCRKSMMTPLDELDLNEDELLLRKNYPMRTTLKSSVRKSEDSSVTRPSLSIWQKTIGDLDAVLSMGESKKSGDQVLRPSRTAGNLRISSRKSIANLRTSSKKSLPKSLQHSKTDANLSSRKSARSSTAVTFDVPQSNDAELSESKKDELKLLERSLPAPVAKSSPMETKEEDVDGDIEI